MGRRRITFFEEQSNRYFEEDEPFEVEGDVGGNQEPLEVVGGQNEDEEPLGVVGIVEGNEEPGQAVEGQFENEEPLGAVGGVEEDEELLEEVSEEEEAQVIQPVASREELVLPQFPPEVSL